MTDRWDVPSDKLRKIAATKNTPSMRTPCAKCGHRHPRGELCGLQVDTLGQGFCRCKQGLDE